MSPKDRRAFPKYRCSDTHARMRITTTVLPFAVVLLLSSSALADTLSFTLADSQVFIDFKLEIKPKWEATGPGKAVRISSVHGTARGFLIGGEPTESFLLVGTCESRESRVNLRTAPLGASTGLSIGGPSLDTGTAKHGPLEGPVVPVSCSSLGL